MYLWRRIRSFLLLFRLVFIPDLNGTPQFVLFLMLSLFYKGQSQFVLQEVIVCSTGKQQFVLQKNIQVQFVLQKYTGIVCSIAKSGMQNKLNLIEQTKPTGLSLFYAPTALNAHKLLEIACRGKQNKLWNRIQFVLLLQSAYKNPQNKLLNG